MAREQVLKQMASSPKVFTAIFNTPAEALEYHQRQLAHGGVVIEALEVRFGQTVQVHLDMDFSGRTYIIEGTVVSATPHGTALQVAALPDNYLEFVEALQRGEFQVKEQFQGTVDPDEDSLAELSAEFGLALEEMASMLEGDEDGEGEGDDGGEPSLGDGGDEVVGPAPSPGRVDEEDGDWIPPWEEDDPPPPPSGSPPDGSPPDGSPPDGSPPDGSPPDGSPPDGFSGSAEEELDEPPSITPLAEPDPPPGSAPAPGDRGAGVAADRTERARAELGGAHITIGSGVTASAIFDGLDELSEDHALSEAPTLAVEVGQSESASEAPTLAVPGPAADLSSSFEIEIEEEDSEEFEFDGESLSQDEESRDSLAGPIYATVQPAVQLGWAQPVADRPSDLQGKVDGKVINDVVRQLSSRRLSGVLRMKLVQRLLVGIWFQGRPVHFIASPPEDGRGASEALAALPELELAAFELALARQRHTGDHLGLELLRMGAIQRKELVAVVRLEAQKYASTLPMRRGGVFGFWECEVPAAEDGSGPDIEALLRWEARVFG